MSVRHINVAIIPCDDSLPLSTLSLVCPGPSAPTPLALPDLLLPHLSPSSIPPSCASTVASFPLRRYDGASPSVHLYALSPTSSPPLPKNVRATTLAFSCGLHSTRLRGDVAVCRVVGEGGGVGGAVASDFDHGEIVVRPDLRVRYAEGGGAQTKAPEWLEGAAQANYSYKSEMARLKCAFKQAPDDGDDSEAEDDDEDDEDDDDDDDEDDDAVVLPPAPPTSSSTHPSASTAAPPPQPPAPPVQPATSAPPPAPPRLGRTRACATLGGNTNQGDARSRNSTG